MFTMESKITNPSLTEVGAAGDQMQAQIMTSLDTAVAQVVSLTFVACGIATALQAWPGRWTGSGFLVTVAPAAASRSAQARPIPDAPPVTSARRPERDIADVMRGP